MRANSSWQWSAFGKHPVASDFFRLGEDAPLLKGFADWVEKGYQALISRRTPAQGLHAWRFWARGSQKENIACGVVRDSSDRVGRPYPFLIIGTGLLNSWEDHWDLMPFACERTWDQIEYLSAFVANDLKKLDQEVHRIRPPQPQWQDFERNRKDLQEGEKRVSLGEDQPELLIEMQINSDHDHLAQASHYHRLIRSRMKMAPNAIFIGGTLDRICLALFRRPLQTSDFVQLWSVSVKG
jgi:type VI secretion system protein VasJ